MSFLNFIVKPGKVISFIRCRISNTLIPKVGSTAIAFAVQKTGNQYQMLWLNLFGLLSSYMIRFPVHSSNQENNRVLNELSFATVLLQPDSIFPHFVLPSLISHVKLILCN